MIRGSVTASLIGYALLIHVKEFGQLLLEISSLLEKISRGLYYERMKLSYLCTAEYYSQCSLTFMRDRYLLRCREKSFAIRAYAMSAVGIDVVSDHKGREHC